MIVASRIPYYVLKSQNPEYSEKVMLTLFYFLLDLIIMPDRFPAGTKNIYAICVQNTKMCITLVFIKVCSNSVMMMMMMVEDNV